MKTFAAYACFTNTSIVVSFTSSELDEDTITTVLNAINTNCANIDDSNLKQLLQKRRSSYRQCEGYDWQSLSGIGTSKELALKELKKSMNEWLPSWVENYYEVGKQVNAYLDENEPKEYTDITSQIDLVFKQD